MNFDKKIQSFTLQQGKSNLLYLSIVAGVAIIVVAVIVEALGTREWTGETTTVRKQNKKIETPSVTPSVDETPPLNEPEIATVSKVENKEELPPDFPKIPLNGKKEITNNYTLNYVSSDSSQKVIEFSSSKSVKENTDFYKNWAEKNELRIIIANKEDSGYRLLVEKDKKPLSVIITKNDDSTSNVIVSW